MALAAAVFMTFHTVLSTHRADMLAVSDAVVLAIVVDGSKFVFSDIPCEVIAALCARRC